jgi:hypothetical protein
MDRALLIAYMGRLALLWRARHQGERRAVVAKPILIFPSRGYKSRKIEMDIGK